MILKVIGIGNVWYTLKENQDAHTQNPLGLTVLFFVKKLGEIIRNLIQSNVVIYNTKLYI